MVVLSTLFQDFRLLFGTSGDVSLDFIAMVVLIGMIICLIFRFIYGLFKL